MEDYVGKICPFCKTEITAEDEVIVCPECKIPHHKGCWEENKGCTTFGCKEQHYEAQHTNPTDVCVNCGAPIGDGQAFCPKCGSPKGGVKKNVCSKCGAELQEGQEFCPKCGQKAGLVIDAGVNSALNQFNAGVSQANKKKKTPIIVGVIIGVFALVVVLIIVLTGTGKKNFKDMFSDMSSNSWCTIASDGSYMKLDTNPYDKDSDDFTYSDYTTFSEANDAIERVNKELGFSDALYEKMNTTTVSQGRQTDSNDKYTVTWTYHPDKGLEVMYEIKK